MRTLTLLCSLSVLASACAFHPFDLGDSTEGDDGHSRWSVSDGLCPGLGSCGLEVPVAAGATIRLSVDVPDRLLAELRPIVVSGDGVIGDVDRDPEHDQLYFDVSAGGAGTIELAIVDSESEVVDRSRVHVVEPVGLECGELTEGAVVGYGMDAMSSDRHDITIVRSTESAPTPQLGCLVTDAEGSPLLSADLVHWHVAETDPLLLYVRSNPFDWIPDGEADGARVYLSPAADAGTATLEASFGDRLETFAITIE
ncbi:MAG: hypothetical protein H6719_09965 [Sandaracinaceae bacterium]|nr:hypothetical protein [Sandaracinaceae bacterium]